MGCALLVIGVCVCVCVCVWAEEPVVAANGCIMIQLRLMKLSVQHYLGSKLRLDVLDHISGLNRSNGNVMLSTETYCHSRQTASTG